MAYNLRPTVSCPDKKGLISALSSFISMHDGNILSADQYVSGEGTFFMRLEIEAKASASPATSSPAPSVPWPAATAWTGASPTPTPRRG